MATRPVRPYRPRALILDMDGLMIDSEPLWYRVEAEFARARGGAWTPELAASCIGRGMRATLDTMHRICGFAVEHDRDAAEIVDRFMARVGELTLKRGCLDLLHAARGRVPVALASSSPRRLIEAVVKALELGPNLDVVLSGEVVAHPKPAPDLFLRAAADLGAPPEACVVLEDSLAGVQAGRAAGMIVIAMPEGPAVPALSSAADTVVADLTEARFLLVLDGS